MADSNPTGERSAIALTLPKAHSTFLRRSIAACLEGVEGDLTLLGDEHPRLEGARRDADAYRRLLTGLGAGEIVPDADLLHVVAEMAQETDESNDYSDVVNEHDALHGLLALLGGSEDESTPLPSSEKD
jgi:hypothetical protein